MDVREIFSQIASHLSVADLKRVSCVCKRWYTLVEALGKSYYDEVIIGFHAATKFPSVGILRYDGSLQIIPDFETGLGSIYIPTKFNFPETISTPDNIHQNPQSATVLLLKRLKKSAEHYLGRRVTKAVVTVPSCFGALRRKTAVEYIQEAGLELVRLVNATTAIAIAYEHQFYHTKETNSLVLSFGGGFLCASLVRFEEGLIEVLAHQGIAFDSFDIDSKNGDVITSTQRECISEAISLCLESAKLNKNEVQEVILNGEPTKSSAVQEMIGNIFNLKPVLFNSGSEILKGTAIYACMLQPKGLNPTFSKTINSLFVIDVCSHSLGLETAGAVMSVLIPRNTSLPTKKEVTFTSYADNACGIPLSVYEGENSSTRNNHKVAEYDLLGVLPAPRGVPRIEITFHLDASGVFSISGVERGSTKPLTFVEKPLPN